MRMTARPPLYELHSDASVKVYVSLISMTRVNEYYITCTGCGDVDHEYKTAA